MFHNQDLVNTQPVNVSRITQGPTFGSQEEKPISPNLTFLKVLFGTVEGQESLLQVRVAGPLPMGVRGSNSILLFLMRTYTGNSSAHFPHPYVKNE